MKRFGFLMMSVVLGASFLCLDAAAQTPKYGGTVVTSNVANVTTLNPVWKYDSPAFNISQNIYSALIIMNFSAKPYGDLAKSWEVSDDRLTYTFHLHDNVYWHDGVKFSSADVKFTYDIAKKENYPVAENLRQVQEIVTPDPNTVVFKMSEVSASFITMLATVSNWYGQILAKHLYEGTDILNNPNNQKPIGTGPFKFVEWQKEQFVTLEANKNYFRGRPYVDKLVFQLFTSKETAQAAFRSGSLDVLAYQLAPPMHEVKSMASLPGVKLWPRSFVYGVDFLFNHTKKPFSDIRVREALSLAVNRDQIVQLAWGGLIKPNPYPNSYQLEFNTNKNARWPDTNLGRANQLLEEAGYPLKGGRRMKLNMIGIEFFKDTVDVTIEQLKQVGIMIDFKLVDTATWFKKMGSQDFDITPFYTRYGPDPDTYSENFGTNLSRNYGKYSNSRVDELLEAGRKSTNVEARKLIYFELQQNLRDDFAYLPITEYPYFIFSKKNVHGVPMGDRSIEGKQMGWSNYQFIWKEQ
jgi:peptide/nickel transport system substrate-binding protein